ncbi:MAG: radical SAM protein [Candidatus Tantalella remota]|nr:radical SAM protein [Candidatus Tantalella remota]
MKREIPKLLIADSKGRVYDSPYLEATGMKGGEYFRLRPSDLVELHPDSELFLLPDRAPIGYNPDSETFVDIAEDPFWPGGEQYSAVAAFVAPGFTSTYSASYREIGRPKMLPLFSYSAVALYKEKFFVAATRVDTEKRQELAGMSVKLLSKKVKAFRKTFPDNRLVRHLERCALEYGCPAAKNFFLERYEGPLPTSPKCNARCIGCISHQPGGECSITQPRITFVPTPEEIAEAALYHISSVADPVVSFGQGCEGEPLMVGNTLIEAVRIIRKVTTKGVINLNTNASRPDVIKQLFDAGLDSIRVSMSSVREKYYSAYHLPKGYAFRDVVKSIKNAKKAGGFVSVNYFVVPGFTDSKGEYAAFRKFLDKTGIDMIQWRNLNFDPRAYFRKLKISVKQSDMIGVKEVIKGIKNDYPDMMHGYFNPSKRRVKRSRSSA